MQRQKASRKKVTVAIKLRLATFYTLEGWLLLGGPNLPEPSTLASFLENLADTLARGVIDPNSIEAELLHSLGHPPPSLSPVDAAPNKL